MKIPDLVFEAIRERDMDFLLIEEFSVSQKFREWLYCKAFGELRPFSEAVARHSVSDAGLGETDCLFLFKNGEQTRAILLENKIDAPHQEEQETRYHDRGALGIQSGSWNEYASVIIAPAEYLTGHSSRVASYSSSVSYEDLESWFKDQEDERPRHLFKAHVVRLAIEQCRRGYQVVPHEGVTSFWHAYWKALSARGSSITMKRPEGIPQKSDWPRLYSAALPAGWVLIHKLKNGFLDLQTPYPAEKSDEISAQLKPILPSDTTVVVTGKSVSIRTLVSSINRFSPFSDQEAEINEAFSRVEQLLAEMKRITNALQIP